MKRTFPKLRKLAAERDVTLTELDLRWGITEEEAKSGKVVDICLREIENSIPFFIGIVGNRYGWVPKKEELGEDVSKHFPMIDEYLESHLSVTEMEMQFGVLERPEDMHAYFYIKEQEENPDNPLMLKRLKEAIIESRYPTSTYNSPENLAEQVEKAFNALLDQLFPDRNISDLEKERIGQRAYMNLLCQYYLCNEKYFQTLEGWFDDKESSHLVITGKSGVGKSALIANWIKKIQERHDKLELVYFFVGQGNKDGNIVGIMSLVHDEICQRYHLSNQLNRYKKSFRNVEMCLSFSLNQIKETDRPLLIVLDGIDRIIGTTNCILFESSFGKTKVLATKTDDHDGIVTFPKDTKYIELHHLNEGDKRLLIKEYLSLFGKSLTEAQTERIANKSITDDTHILRNLLDELISNGHFETLDSIIDKYLSQTNAIGFYQQLLNDYEEDFGKDMVQLVLSLIAVSECGLEESEIINAGHIKPLEWSQFYNRLYHHFHTPIGAVTFANTYFYNAVKTRYLDDNDSWRQQCREMLIDSLTHLETNHAKSELAFQLSVTEKYNELHDLLLNLDYLRVFSSKLVTYWNLLLKNGSFSLEDYNSEIEQYNKPDVSELLQILINICEAMKLPDAMLLYLTLRLKHTTGIEDKAIVYEDLSQAHELNGDYQQALRYQLLEIETYFPLYEAKKQQLSHRMTRFYQRASSLCEKLGDSIGMLNYLEKELEISLKEASTNSYGLFLINDLVERCLENNMFEKALSWAKKAVEQEPDDINSIEILSKVYKELGQYEEALEQLERCLILLREQEETDDCIHEITEKANELKKLTKQGS